LVEREIAVVGEVYPACEWLGCLLKGLLPIVFQWRRTYYDRDIFCRGCNLQHVLEQPVKINFLADVSRVLLQCARRKKPPIDYVDDRRFRKQPVTMVCYEGSCGRSDRNDEIGLPFGLPLLQIINNRLLYVAVGVARHIQRHFVQVNAIAHLRD
jgi:hypothetical protein